MKKVLILLGRYFPKASANSICVQNIINALPKDQYKVEVISYDDGLYSDYDLEVVKFNRGPIQSFLYSCEKNDKNNTVIVKLFHLIIKAKYLLCFTIWPWFDPITTLKEFALVKKEYKKKNFDIIVAVHMPFSSLYVANKLKKKYPKIKYIAYFLDSLSGGYVPNHVNKERYERKSERWEKRLLKNADKIVFMKSSQKYHDDLYRNTDLENKIIYLDLPMLLERKSNTSIISGHVKIVYVGSLSSSMRSPEYFLKVFSQICDPSWELIFVGDSSCQIVNDFAMKDNRIKVIGRCSHEEALIYENQASILLNLGNRNPNMAPSKVFEYMSWCKKIVSTYSIDNDTSISYLKKYPSALMLDERSSIDASAKQLINFINMHDSVDYAYVSKEFHRNTPSAFIDLL